MILSTFEQLTRYQPLSQNFADALAWAQQTDWAALTEGKHDIDGERLFVIYETVDLRPLRADSIWEAHNRYIDIQYLLEGTERMGWMPRTESLPVKTPYDFETDKVFYDTPQMQGAMIDVAPGQAAVFFPEDTHAPCLCVEQPAQAKKAVFKVRVD